MSEETQPQRGRKLKKQSAELLEIVGRISSRRTDVEDELTKAIDDAIRLKAREYRLKLLDKMNKELEKDLNDLDEVLSVAKSKSINKSSESELVEGLHPSFIIEISKLPEEQRKKVIETYTLLKLADKNSSNVGMVLPLLIGYAKENRDASTNEMFNWAKIQLDTMRTAWEMAKSGEKPKEKDNEFLKIFLDMFNAIMEKERESRQKELELFKKELEASRQPGLLEAILFDDNVRRVLKELGLFNPPRQVGINPEIQLQIEQMRMQHEREMKRMEMEFQLRLQELQQRQNQTLALLSGLRTIGASVADAFMNTPLPQENIQKEPMNTPRILKEKCPKCGAEITFPETAKEVQCPNCKSVFKVEG